LYGAQRARGGKRTENGEQSRTPVGLAPAAEIERGRDRAQQQRGGQRQRKLRRPSAPSEGNESRKEERGETAPEPESYTHADIIGAAEFAWNSHWWPGQEITHMLETRTNAINDQNKILAIEDDPEVLALYKSYLQKRGYEVLSATGAVEGMSLLQQNPDTRLILLDLNLPGMSGEEWIAWYVQQGKETPVVVASGKGDILTITKGNNMTAALTKPFHMEELQELIEVLLADDWHEQVSVDKKLH